jgi:hypothetical protein
MLSLKLASPPRLLLADMGKAFTCHTERRKAERGLRELAIMSVFVSVCVKQRQQIRVAFFNVKCTVYSRESDNRKGRLCLFN